MPDRALGEPIRTDADINRMLLSRVRDDPRPYPQREQFASEAIRALLARLGNPHQQLRCVHIAGSKGKGSVALMCEHLLQHAGLRAGTFTSPHLQRWNERIRIDGRDAQTALLAQALETVRPHIAQLDEISEELSPSFFDVLTATALLMFANARCDAVIVETGLGGSFDATNVIIPLACCITSVELEHTEKLGATVQAIARHKAGIIKAGVPVVMARFADTAQAVIEQRAHSLGAPQWRLGHDWTVHIAHAGTSSQRIEYSRSAQQTIGAQQQSFTVPHAAPHMAVNAGLALTLLATAKWPVDASALRTCVLPARAQLISQRPWIVVDSAHTQASMQALEQTLQQWPARKRCFVIAATRGKSLHALAALVRDADALWITCADPLRSISAAQLAASLKIELPQLTPQVFEHPATAFELAAAELGADTLLCICGSVYLAGAALRYWQVNTDQKNFSEPHTHPATNATKEPL
jgi:dihydrofolate synthase/folylpolyglutamate synthase